MKKIIISATAISLLILSGCSNSNSNNGNNSGQEQTKTKKEENNLATNIAKEYKTIVEKGKDNFTQVTLPENKTYKLDYTLTHINEDNIPELIVRLHDGEGREYNKIYSYNGENNSIIENKDLVMSGVFPVGGFRAVLDASKEKNGLYKNGGYSGTGEFEVHKIILENYKFSEKVIYKYKMGVNNPDTNDYEKIKFVPIDNKESLVKLAKTPIKKVSIAEINNIKIENPKNRGD